MNLSQVDATDLSLMFEPGAWHRVKKEKPIDLPAIWRSIAEDNNMSLEVRLRLEWMLFFRVGNTVTKTCTHFGITRSVFYKWKRLFDEKGVEALETHSRAPLKTRKCK